MKFPKDFPRKGELYYVSAAESTGSEIRGNRHAVIVSSDKLNKNSGVVMVVYVTTKNKSASRFHVDISTKQTHRVALCEQVFTVDKSRLCEYKGCIAPFHQENIDEALAYTLSL